MNGFDAEKIAKHGEVWTIGFEPYLIVERDGRKFAVRLVDERSIASNLPARRGWPENKPPSRVTLCGDPFDPAEKKVKDLETKQRRAIALSTLALLRRLEWAGEHGACIECRACPRCDWSNAHRYCAEPQEDQLARVHRDGCALKAEIDRFEKEIA